MRSCAFSSNADVTLTPIEPTHELANVLYTKFGTPNMWSVDVKNQNIVMQITTPIASFEVVDDTFTPVNDIAPMLFGGVQFMIQGPRENNVTRFLVMKDAAGNVVAVLHYYFWW